MQACRRGRAAFTILEVLVSCAVLALILVVMMALISQTSDLWRRSNARIDAFQSARRGFENLTRLLEQATLNTYWDYNDPNNPEKYIRQSELHFLVGDAGAGGLPGTPGTGQAVFFQAPANKTNDNAYESATGLLNGCGFFIQYGSDASWLPAHVDPSQARSRFRLMQWMQDTEELKVYGYDKGGGKQTVDSDAWIPSTVSADAIPIADNVIALVIWPREEGNSHAILNAYTYDSREDSRPEAINQLPPVLQIALVAMDEASAERLGTGLQGAVEDCLKDLFISNPDETFADNLKTLEGRLADKGITFRAFTSAVPMREAKWSPD